MSSRRTCIGYENVGRVRKQNVVLARRRDIVAFRFVPRSSIFLSPSPLAFSLVYYLCSFTFSPPFASISLPPSLSFSSSAFSFERAANGDRQSGWFSRLSLSIPLSLGRYYYIRYKNVRVRRRVRKNSSAGEECPPRQGGSSRGLRRLLARSILVINFFVRLIPFFSLSLFLHPLDLHLSFSSSPSRSLATQPYVVSAAGSLASLLFSG